MKTKIILNPYANRWGAKKKAELVKQAAQQAGLDYDLSLTTKRKDGTQLAVEAVKAGYGAVVAAGGDGTINEVINGLIHASGDEPTVPLGVLPMGTGNDLNDMIGFPRELNSIMAYLAEGKTRQIDAGRMNDHYFANNCALAMEPMVTLENEKMTRLSGNIRYIAALIKSLFKLQAWDMKITWDDGEYIGPTLLLSVCNGPRTGGQFMMAPGAKFDDGLFNFIHAPDLPMIQVLGILPRLFGGSHINHPKVNQYQTTRLTVESNPGTPIHADGEVIAKAETRVEYEILPGKLTLLTP